MATNLTEVENIIQLFIDHIQKEKYISKVYLYGSYAKGFAGQWSDIDIAVVSPDFSPDLLQERIRLMKLALLVDARIEPSPFRPEDFTQDNPLVHEIHESGIEIETKGSS